MMLSDKEIALRLLDMIEELYIQKNAREAVLQALHGHECDWFVEKLESRPDVKALAREKIEPLRQLVLDAPDLTSIVRGIVEGLEQIDPEETD